MANGILGHYGMLVGVALSPAQSIINAMDNEPSNDRKALITDTYNALDAAGIWGKADVLAFRAAADEQAGLLDWNRLVDHTWTAGDGSFVADSGFDTRISSGGAGISTGFNLATDGVNYQTDSACIAVLVSDYLSDGGYLFGAYGGFNVTHLGYDTYAGGTVTGVINSENDAPYAEELSATPNGFWILQRVGATSVELYKDGALFASSNIASTAAPNDTLKQGSNGGSPLQARHKFIYAGAPLDSTERTALQTIVNDYLAGL